MRQDLLALTEDDLITLSNRGTVKRVKRELKKLSAEITLDPDNTVIVAWSDNNTCTLPAATRLAEADCTCVKIGLCRHLVRSVLAYQSWAAEQESAEPAIVAPWNPGSIADAQLAPHFRKGQLTRLRKEFEQGHVVELVCSSKPTAYFHSLSLTVRFLVPNELAYTVCDCAETAPCRHVPLAIWAFRLLDGESGLIETAKQALPIPTVLLDQIEENIRDWLELGLAGAVGQLVERTRRLAVRCRSAELLWPATLIDDLLTEYDRYTRHDARFDPNRVTQLIGELLVRMRSIRAGSPNVPSLFVRGNQRKTVTDIGRTRLIGLGSYVSTQAKTTIVKVFMQDVHSADILTIEHTHYNKEEGDPLLHATLGSRRVTKGFALRDLAAGQLLINGGKRTATGMLKLSRQAASLNPQSFQWEQLRAPLLSADFGELLARRRAQPPSALRPRSASGDLHVCPVARVENVAFDWATQMISAELYDEAGTMTRLQHPYTTRGAAGCEALLARLQQERLLFVAGLFDSSLTVRPTALIFEGSKGREMLQPSLASWEGGQSRLDGVVVEGISAEPHHLFLNDLTHALNQLWVEGVRRVSPHAARRWRRLAQDARRVGFVRVAEHVAQLAVQFDNKQRQIDWGYDVAMQHTAQLTLILALGDTFNLL